MNQYYITELLIKSLVKKGLCLWVTVNQSDGRPVIVHERVAFLIHHDMHP